MLTLRQLEIFITVARLENITKAAEKLSLTQAAVSMAINEIEKLLMIIYILNAELIIQ